MKILILTADYDSFLRYQYVGTPSLVKASYDEQLQERFASLFGVADFYSRNFQALGHEAHEIFANNIWMQTAWAREHGMSVPEPPAPTALTARGQNDFAMLLKRKLQRYRDLLLPLAKRLGYAAALSKVERSILVAQIEHYNPDIILNQILGMADGQIMRQVKRPGRILIAQYGSQPPDDFDASPYTFGISLIPWVVEFFRERGLPAENCHLAFDPSVLDRISPQPARDIDLSFVGGLASNHGRRIELLEAIAREFPIELWVSGLKGIPASSALHARARGAVWGGEMYNVLRRSKITLNSHIDAARGMAGNMRLYEATGVGTFLLTDNLPNLPTLFEPGVHVGAYDSVDDCLAKIRHYLARDEERQRIAKAGQDHTLSHHTYRLRIEELMRLVQKYGS